MQDAILQAALQQIEKRLKEMQKEGKDLSLLKIKKFQKTHFESCSCQDCLKAKQQQNPRLKGIQEDGFKIYIAHDCVPSSKT